MLMGLVFVAMETALGQHMEFISCVKLTAANLH